MDDGAGLSVPAEIRAVGAHDSRGRYARGLATRLLVCLSLAAVADWLFLRQPIGWAVGPFVALTAVAIVAFRPHALRRRSTQMIFALELGLAFALVIEPLPRTVLAAGFGLVGLALITRQRFTADVKAWVQRYAFFAVRGLGQPLRDVAVVSRWGSRPGAPAREPLAVSRWVLPVVLGCVFLALFAVANPVIGRWLDRTADALREALGGIDVARVFFWLFVAWGAWALLRTRTPGFEQAPRTRIRGELLSIPTLVRCLVVFNLLFLVQHALDLRYLFLGAELPDGLTYAEYAQRGAYPLVFTALLAAAFVLLTFRAGANQDKDATKWARRLVYVWLFQNVLLAFAAATRLSLYVEAYTLTRLRLAAAAWMALVAVGLVLIAVRVLTDRSNRWLVSANTVAVFVVLYASCFVDTDRFIATYNVGHSAEVTGSGKPLDRGYLDHLGVSALPAWRQLGVAALDPEVGAGARTQALTLERRLDRELSTWRGYTLRRSALRNAER